MQFAELVNQIAQHVTPTLEPWVKGAHGVPSSLSCIVYRLQESKILERELSYMLSSL
jgi:PRP38 family